MSFRDPIIEELYAVRKELLTDCNDDIMELARRQQQNPIPAGMRLVSVEEVRARQREMDAMRDGSISAGA
jgi:hypothetical protein